MGRMMVGARIDEEAVTRLDAIAEAMGERSQGADVGRADAVRATIMLGIEVLEKKLGISAPKEKKKPARKPKA